MSLMFNVIGSNLSDDTVSLPVLSFDTTGLTGPVYSGIRFNTNGNIEKFTAAGAWQFAGVWLLKGTASNYWVQRTITEGSLNDNDAGTGADSDDTQLDASIYYSLTESSPNDTNTASITFEISTDQAGTAVKAGPRSYELSAFFDTLD